jgi:hypothetical protein
LFRNNHFDTPKSKIQFLLLFLEIMNCLFRKKLTTGTRYLLKQVNQNRIQILPKNTLFQHASN